MANERTAPLSDNAFARWLSDRMADRGIDGYRPLETAMKRRGMRTGASQLWTYVHGGVLPTRAVADRLAIFFGWDPDAVWRLRLRAQHEAESAFLPDLPTAPAVGGTLASGGASGPAGAEASILAEVARPLLTGDMTPEELAYLQDFARRVNRRLAAAGGRDDAGRGGPAGADDPD